jgi:hypothetical protein
VASAWLIAGPIVSISRVACFEPGFVSGIAVNPSQAQAMAADILACEEKRPKKQFEEDLSRISDFLTVTLPEMSEEWAVIQKKGLDGQLRTPAIFALEDGVLWEIAVGPRIRGKRGARRITIGVYQKDELGILIKP